MKLIDLLVKELPKRGGWPEGAEIAVQDADSQICFSSHSDVYANEGQTYWYGGDWGDGEWSNPFIDTIADDRHNSIVTRNQYESALAASKAVVGHNGWIQWAGGECPVDSDAIVEVICRDHNQYQFNSDRAGDFDWSHDGIGGDIIAYRLQNTTKSELVRTDAWRAYAGITENDDEADLNECIGQGVEMPEWDGEGLPPVGTICEAKVPRSITGWEWRKVKVVESGIPGAEKEVLVYDLETTFPSWTDEFRPLRTEAEKARELAVEDITNSMGAFGVKSVSESLYAAISAGKIRGVKLEDK